MWGNPTLKRKPKCIRCGDCCKRFELDLNTKTQNPDTAKAIELVLRSFAHQGIILKEIKRVRFRIEGICRNYNEEKKECEIYEKRKPICSNFFCGKHF